MISTSQQLKECVANIHNEDFMVLANEIYRFQAENNVVFKTYLNTLQGKKSDTMYFLPISAFKNHEIKTGTWATTEYFESSGTTSNRNSRHYINDIVWYLNNCEKGFNFMYSSVKPYCFFALLPHYLERKNSSLIAMVNYFIGQSNYPQSGFFLNDTDHLHRMLKENATRKIPTLLFGVSFALKDFAEKYPIDFPELVVMETGGMKGRQEEITREDLYAIIENGFRTKNIHSEYGMTELFSQAYAKQNGRFYPTPTLKIQIKEITDPLSDEIQNKTGVINIIDLANVDTCSFIATEDLGKQFEDGSFEVLGRMDNSDMRGCNLMLL